MHSLETYLTSMVKHIQCKPAFSFIVPSNIFNGQFFLVSCVYKIVMAYQPYRPTEIDALYQREKFVVLLLDN